MTVRSEWAKLTETIAAADMRLDFLPPTPESEVARAESTTTPWPKQLREFYELHNGQNAGAGRDFGALLPLTEWFPIQMLEAEHARLAGDGEAELEGDSWLQEQILDSEAGVPSDVFLHTYVPICGLDSYYYFCDTRPGPHSGCIRQWTRDNGDNSQLPIWDSIEEMLRAVRTSITDGTPLMDLWWHERDPESRALTWSTQKVVSD